ncbi:hypothetical protein HCN44_000408 [Aphidius gifuensis]|uniref:Uncharacterized protein n=1 Tax=Aphidius gifuensis TaxID=684658 RepID=A0A835CQV6_APHGI|nr:hypothetical protein HCN44_000408 [Aphidius gifuensis]
MHHYIYNSSAGAIVIDGERLTLDKAIIKGLIRHDSPSIKDPHTCEVITLSDAIKFGLIDSNNGTALDLLTGTALSIIDAMDPGLVVLEKRKISLPDTVFKGFYDPKSGHFTSLETREWLPTDRAIKEGVIDPTSEIVKNSKEQSIDFQEAFEEGVLLEARRPMSFSEALLKGIFDKKTSLFLDPKTGSYLILLQAIERNIIDADSVTVKNSTIIGYSKKISLVKVIKLGIIDGKTGKVKDINYKKNNTEITFDQAYEIGLIIDNKAAISIQRAIHQGLYDDKSSKIIDPSSGRSITLLEATHICIISPKLICYWDKRGEILLPLAETCR